MGIDIDPLTVGSLKRSQPQSQVSTPLDPATFVSLSNSAPDSGALLGDGRTIDYKGSHQIGFEGVSIFMALSRQRGDGSDFELRSALDCDCLFAGLEY
jgi:hypothetical protein